ncbi:MAG: cytochrome P450 [Pseudomonadota bacterium]
MKTLKQSPLDPGFVQNPYATYAEILQDDDPVRFWQDYGKVAVFDAASVQSLLRDRRLGRAMPAHLKASTPPHLADFAALEEVSMLELEPPVHTRLRRLVLRAFTSSRIAHLEPDIHAICDMLLAKLPKGRFDLLPAYCAPLPVRVIARLLGVPEAASCDLLRWSNAMVAMYQAGRTKQIEVAANEAAAAFTAFLSGHIDARRKTPGQDLLSELIKAEEDGQKLTRQELIGTAILLLNAGHEATVHTLGNAVKTLLETRRPWQTITEAVVEEILRFDPPLHVFNRFVYEPVSVGPHRLEPGQEIMLVLGAAGHDPRAVSNPAVFTPSRPSVPHAAFGGGLHFCVGAPLARLELKIGLQRLFEAFPDLQMEEPTRYANSYHFHGLETLIVSTGTRAL